MHQFSFPLFGKKDKKHAAEKQTSPEAASYSVNEVMCVNMGNHFMNKLPEIVCLGCWDFFDWTGFDMAGQSRRVHARVPRELIVLIGTLSSNQKDVSPFPILSKKKKKKNAMEFQILKATSVIITTMILQTCMLTANLRIGDFQLIISLPINKGSYWNVPLC